MTWRAFVQVLRVAEAPIIFYERRLGQSKIDFRIMMEAATGVLRLRYKARPSTIRKAAALVAVK